MFRKITFFLSAITTLFPLFMANNLTYAQDEVFNFKRLNCRDLLIMPGEEREYTLVFFHGVLSGKNNETSFDTNQYAEVTDKVIRDCIDNPEATIMSVFEKYR